jgi:hypothetical protein
MDKDSKILNFALWLLVGSLALAMFVPVGWIFLKTLGAI